jgi:hypothetical protein
MVGRLLIPYVGGGDCMRALSGMSFTAILIISYFGYFKDVQED